MARVKMVTRTVIENRFDIMVVDSATKTVESISVSIPSADGLSDKAKEKAIKALIPDSKLFVSITGESKTETLYGMPESDFIKLAKVLPPRTASNDNGNE